MKKSFRWSKQETQKWGNLVKRDRTRAPRERTRQLEAALRNPRTGAVYGTGLVHNDEVMANKFGVKNSGQYDMGFINEAGTKWTPKGNLFENMLASMDVAFAPPPQEWTPLKPGQLKGRVYEGRKSSGGGEVEVSAYDREGKPVSGYTRRKPK